MQASARKAWRCRRLFCRTREETGRNCIRPECILGAAQGIAGYGYLQEDFVEAPLVHMDSPNRIQACPVSKSGSVQNVYALAFCTRAFSGFIPLGDKQL